MSWVANQRFDCAYTTLDTAYSLLLIFFVHCSLYINVFALLISMPRFKSTSFYQNRPKIKLFCQKIIKFSSAGGSVGRPPRASGGWRLCHQTPEHSLPPSLQICGNAPATMHAIMKLFSPSFVFNYFRKNRHFKKFKYTAVACW